MIAARGQFEPVAVGVVDEQELLPVVARSWRPDDFDLGLFQGVSRRFDVGNFKRNVLPAVATRADRFRRVDYVNHRAVAHLCPCEAVAIDLVGDHVDIQQVPVHPHAPGPVIYRQSNVIDGDDLDIRRRPGRRSNGRVGSRITGVAVSVNHPCCRAQTACRGEFEPVAVVVIDGDMALAVVPFARITDIRKSRVPQVLDRRVEIFHLERCVRLDEGFTVGRLDKVDHRSVQGPGPDDVLRIDH